jgi:hypothetical protein
VWPDLEVGVWAEETLPEEFQINSNFKLNGNILFEVLIYVLMRGLCRFEVNDPMEVRPSP